MLFDLGWSEILLIGTVALVFIGPKDLPKAMRVAGYWVRKARTLSREFQGSIDQMIREAELDEMRQELKKAAEFDLDKEFHNTIDPTGSLREGLKPPELPNLSATEPVPPPVGANGTEPAAHAPSEPVAAPRPPELPSFSTTEPVPMVAAPESEPDEIAAAAPARAEIPGAEIPGAEIAGIEPAAVPPVPPPPETSARGLVPPKS